MPDDTKNTTTGAATTTPSVSTAKEAPAPATPKPTPVAAPTEKVEGVLLADAERDASEETRGSGEGGKKAFVANQQPAASTVHHYNDEYVGKGGSYTYKDGKRVPILEEVEDADGNKIVQPVR